MAPLNGSSDVVTGRNYVVTPAKNRFAVRLDISVVTATETRWLCYPRKCLSRFRVGLRRVSGKLSLPASHDRGCETVAHEINGGPRHIHQGVHA